MWTYLHVARLQRPAGDICLTLALAVVQFIASPVLLHRNFLSTVLANALYGVALSYYHYLNFLGYSALPFLQHTEVSSCTLSFSSPHAAYEGLPPVLIRCLVV